MDGDLPPKPIKFIRKLCEGKSESELISAEQYFRDYLWVLKEMCDRIEVENYDEMAFDEE